jgi:tetratricopeptide (TPR) repeat protein
MKVFKIICFFLLLAGTVNAQSNNQQMAQKAILDGNFKVAIVHLEKALAAEPGNINNLYMLGYSYYHAGRYAKAISTFDRLINLKPEELSAYYYRGKAKNIVAMETVKLSMPEREKYLKSSIQDFSRAIELNQDDVKLYQNRGMAYKDYGTLRGQKTSNFYDKSVASAALKSSLTDLEKVLELTPGRRDITTQVTEVKRFLKTLK